MLDEKAQLVVAGGGLAAYAAALAAARHGAEVLLIPAGAKSWALFGGGFFTRGYVHDEAFQTWAELYAAAGYPLAVCHAGEAFLLPTTMGTARAADLIPEEFATADLRRPDPLLLIGWQELPVFSAAWAAAALRQRLGEGAVRPGNSSPDVTSPLVLAGTLAVSEVFPQLVSDRARRAGDYPGFNWRALAREMEQPEAVRQLVNALDRAFARADLPAAVRQARAEGRLRIALPVVGLNHPQFVRREVHRLTGLLLSELAGLLPAPGGVRARAILERALAEARVTVRPGWTVTRVAAGAPPTVSGYVQGTEEEFTVTGEYLILAPDFASDPLTYLAAQVAANGRHPGSRLVLAGAASRVASSELRPVPGNIHASLWRSGYWAGREVAANLPGRSNAPVGDGCRVGEGAR